MFCGLQCPTTLRFSNIQLPILVRSLTDMLKRRVREIEFLSYNATLDDYSLLAKYDGQGCCERIHLKSKNDEDRVKKIFSSWAKSNGWTVAEEIHIHAPYHYAYNSFEIKRLTREENGAIGKTRTTM